MYRNNPTYKDNTTKNDLIPNKETQPKKVLTNENNEKRDENRVVNNNEKQEITNDKKLDLATERYGSKNNASIVGKREENTISSEWKKSELVSHNKRKE